MSATTKNKNELYSTIDNMPFSGKFFVKDTYLEYTTSPDKDRTRQLIGGAAILGCMAALHAFQAKLGFDSLATHESHVADNPDVKDVVFGNIDVAYMAAMSAVTLRQADLLRKVGQKHYKWLKTRKNIPEGDRKTTRRLEAEDFDSAKKSKAMKTAVYVTIAGQTVGVVSMLDAMMQGYQGQEWDFHPTTPYVIDAVPEYAPGDIYETNTVRIEIPNKELPK